MHDHFIKFTVIKYVFAANTGLGENFNLGDFCLHKLCVTKYHIYRAQEKKKKVKL